MAHYTVHSAFEGFRQSIEPPSYDRQTATARKDRVVQLLGSRFTILNAFPMGSLPRYTAVREHADLDVMVVLHYGDHIKNKLPSQVLADVQQHLSPEYKVAVRRNGQAVTLYFKTWPNVDIVPVSRTVNADRSVSHYNVPDMHNETWIQSQPVRHSHDLRDKNKAFGEEFKRIIKMIKWWNHQHSTLLQSYHIEVLALRLLEGRFGNYPWEIYQFFDKAIPLVRSRLWHNTGYVDSYLNTTKRDAALSRLISARDKSHQAWSRTSGTDDDHQGAIEIWRQIFRNRFPSYG